MGIEMVGIDREEAPDGVPKFGSASTGTPKILDTSTAILDIGLKNRK